MQINYAPVLGGTETETDDNSNEKMDVALCPTRKISIKMTMVMMMTMKMKMTTTTRVILMTMMKRMTTRVMTIQNEGAQEDVLNSTKGAGATIKDLRTSTGLRLQDDQDHDDDDLIHKSSLLVPSFRILNKADIFFFLHYFPVTSEPLCLNSQS